MNGSLKRRKWCETAGQKKILTRRSRNSIIRYSEIKMALTDKDKKDIAARVARISPKAKMAFLKKEAAKGSLRAKKALERIEAKQK